MSDLLDHVTVLFLVVSAGLFWGIVIVWAWGATEGRRKVLRDKIMGRNLLKLLALEKDLARLRSQIDQDFPGELAEYHPYDYDEQHVLATAGLLLGKYCAYARAGRLTRTGQAAFYHASDISEDGVVGKPPDQPTFATRRLPGRAVHRVDG